MNAISISRLVSLCAALLLGALATGCAVVPQGNSPVRADVLTGTNVPVKEARRALTSSMGVVQDATLVTIADPSVAGQNRAVGGSFGAVLGYVAAEALKVSKAGRVLGVMVGGAIGSSITAGQTPQVRTAEQVVVRLTNGKSVVVVQELEVNGKPMAIGEAVIVVAGPSTTRVVRQAAAVAANPAHPHP